MLFSYVERSFRKSLSHLVWHYNFSYVNSIQTCVEKSDKGGTQIRNDYRK